jgi:hypothetical protein
MSRSLRAWKFLVQLAGVATLLESERGGGILWKRRRRMAKKETAKKKGGHC